VGYGCWHAGARGMLNRLDDLLVPSIDPELISPGFGIPALPVNAVRPSACRPRALISTPNQTTRKEPHEMRPAVSRLDETM
jgi:hypothetical protein